MREYEITLTTRVQAESAKAAKQKLQMQLGHNGFDAGFHFDRIMGAMYCPGCGRNEITGVRWSERYKGIESVKLDGSICCSHDEGDYPTAESAAREIEFWNARLRAGAGIVEPEANSDMETSA